MVGAVGPHVSRIELYTPWRESPASLLHRNVGRAVQIRRLAQGITNLVSAPAPDERIKGTAPAAVVIPVMTMGRSLISDA